jgi:succinate dehydrogenase / fumarate reductase membrane anchor subunit
MRYWFLNAICGLVVLVLLTAHMFTMHLDDVLALIVSFDTEPLSWTAVSQRGASSLYTTVYIVLLGTALFHGFYGLRTILTEVWSSERAGKIIRFGCWLVGIGLFAIGTAAALMYHAQQAVA